jgi:hypothetical protein
MIFFSRCSPLFTGSRCEISLFPNNSSTFFNTTTNLPFTISSNTTTITTTQSTSTQTYQPRCNITITLLNNGAYTARMRVSYVIDGILQPNYVSRGLAIIGDSATVTIPWYSTNITVYGEKLFVLYYNIFTDTGINTTAACTKCYKVWGAVTNPYWDYYVC